MDIARYRATLQALTEARRSAAEALASGGLDAAEREQWIWTLSLFDSIERTAQSMLRQGVLVSG